MNNLNSILVEGNLTRDPVLSATPKGTSVCTFAVASNRYYRTNDETQQEVSFFDIETWARLAEACGNTLKKGRGVRVVGRLKQDRWVDPEGKTRSKLKIVAEHVEFKPEFRKVAGNSGDEVEAVESDAEIGVAADGAEAGKEEVLTF